VRASGHAVAVSSTPPVPPADILYDTFARYEYAGNRFCDFCYEQEEWREIARGPVRVLEIDRARKLLWETADHWESADVSKHYLPRIMEVLAPPADVEPLYPIHVSETLLSLGFGNWNQIEREAIVSYLELLTPHLTWLRGGDDRREWTRGIAALKRTAQP
jgi:hypothetical protein